MKFAFTLAAAGLSLASAISDRNDIDIIVFKDVHTDPRWSNATELRDRRDEDKAIYGGDSRQDEADTTDFWRSIGRSTVILTSSSATSGSVWRSCGTLGSRYRCPSGLRFSTQMTCGSCSGTLIAPDLVSTAGHCINSGSCSSKRIVFGATNVNMRAGNAIPAGSLYSCASVVRTVNSGGQDWAVFRLNGVVPSSVAVPATVGSGQMPRGTGLMMIGHPSGLPRKYAGDANVISVRSGGLAALSYGTDLDAFGGNSGSGVFTTGSTTSSTCYPAGILVGILVNGATDYTSDGCPATYPQGQGGEGVSGAVNLVPYATSVSASAGAIPCGGTNPPPTTPAPQNPTVAPPTNAPGVGQGTLACGQTYTGDTTGAEHVVGSSSGDHYYRFTVTSATTYVFSTCEGSQYDTQLRLYSGDHLAASGEELAVNDDSCGWQSRIEESLEPGNYSLVVEGFNDREGFYTLSVACSGSGGAPTTTPPSAPAPTSAAPTAAAPTAAAPTSSNTGPLAVTVGANFCQIDANGCATDGEGAHGNGEACTIRVAAAGFVTATQFDTESCCDRVTIGGTPYRGLTGPNGVAVAAGSIFTWTSDSSVTRAGWTICWSATPPPPTIAPPSTPAPTSAAPTAAAPTDAANPASSGNLACGSTFTGDTTGAIHVVGTGSGEHFYRLAVSSAAQYTFSTCEGSAYDTRLRLYTGDHLEASSIELANVDDSCDLLSIIQIGLEPGSYTLVVEGYSTRSEGAYTLSTTCGPIETTPPPGDTTGANTPPPGESSGAITCGSTVTGNTTGATHVVGSSSGEHWYTVTVTETQRWTFSTCEGSAYDTRLRLYTGSHLEASGLEIANVDDSCGFQSIIQMELEPANYTLIVEGFSRHEGAYTVTTTCDDGAPTTAPPSAPVPATPEPDGSDDGGDDTTTASVFEITTPSTSSPDATTLAPGTCPRNCGTPENGGGTCRPSGVCLSCNDNRLRVNGRCVQSVACRARRIQSGAMTDQNCRCLDASCHYCNRAVGSDTCRVCRDGWYLLNGECVETCPAGMTQLGISNFRRRCLAPFECQNGRIQGQDVNYGCRCATEENTPSACQFCSFRADEHGEYCTRCLGATFLYANRCQANCDGLFESEGLISYIPGNYGRECRAPFTCANRLDENGRACKCSRSVGNNNCVVCDYGEAGATCIRCTGGKFLQDGACVAECAGDGGATGLENQDGRECN